MYLGLTLSTQREGEPMRIRLIRPFLALLVYSIIAVGALTACGSSSTPTNTPAPAPASSTKTPTTPAKSADGCPAGQTIPQGGGDNDGDNSGGPSDGDGC